MRKPLFGIKLYNCNMLQKKRKDLKEINNLYTVLMIHDRISNETSAAVCATSPSWMLMIE